MSKSFPSLLLLLAAAALLLTVPSLETRAEDAEATPVPKRIAFFKDLGEAFEAAKERDLPLMICINSRRVDGGRVEPAARELRERTYKHEDVVKLSQGFVCALLTSQGTSDDFGELRLRYGIDGDIVSPQHIFAYSDGKLIMRKEYWPYGYAQRAVDALLKLMKDALARTRSRRGLPPSDGNTPGGDAPEGDTPRGDTPKSGTPSEPGEGTDDDHVPGDTGAPEAPEGGEERATWIRDQLARVRSPDEHERRAALSALLQADKEGDTLGPVLALLEEMEEHVAVRVDIVRALGRPGLEGAVKTLTKLLADKVDDVRANAAVSLEYIGSKEAVSALRKRATKEKDEAIANHMWRALGRCGAGESKVRSLLLKNVDGSGSEISSYGPIIGLAYFEGDGKAARAIEKHLKKLGVPGWRRGGPRGGAKRALLTWCLTEVGFGNPKAAKFIREDIVPLYAGNRWWARVVPFYESAAKVCDGDEDARGDVADGVQFTLGRNRDGSQIVDEARRNRDDVGFQPKPEWSQ